MILNMICGFCMALADSVPGVSGGTVAFILGFYEKFIGALRNLFSSDGGKRKAALIYLCKLGMGWIVGFLISMSLLSALFKSNIYFMSSLFLGLSLSAIPFIIHSERAVLRGKYLNILYVIAGFMVVAGLTFFMSADAGSGSLDFQALNASQMIYLFVSGMIAITAMVLPGISGSTLLLMMGIYLPAVYRLQKIPHEKNCKLQRSAYNHSFLI